MLDSMPDSFSGVLKLTATITATAVSTIANRIAATRIQLKLHLIDVFARC